MCAWGARVGPGEQVMVEKAADRLADAAFEVGELCKGDDSLESSTSSSSSKTGREAAVGSDGGKAPSGQAASCAAAGAGGSAQAAKACAVCGLKAEDGTKLKACSGCKGLLDVMYCSVSCRERGRWWL